MVLTLENKGKRNTGQAGQERSIAGLEEALREKWKNGPFQNSHWCCFLPSGS